MFFASAKQYCEVLKATGLKAKVLIIRMRHVPFVDTTGLNNLKDALRILIDSEIKVVLSGVNDVVCADIKKAGIDRLVGEGNIFDSFDKAAEGAKNML